MGIDVLHCIAPQGRKFWSFDEFWADFCIFVIFPMECMLIYLCFPMKTLFTYKILIISLIYLWSREGGTPPTQRTNLRSAQIVEDLKNFHFGRPMNGTCVWIRQGSRNEESFGKVFPIPEGKIQWKWEGSDLFYGTALAPQRPLSIAFPVFAEKYFLPRSLEIQEPFPHGTMTA